MTHGMEEWGERIDSLVLLSYLFDNLKKKISWLVDR